MKQRMKKLFPIAIVIALVLIVSIGSLAALLANADERELISVEQGTVATVPYGTTIDEALQSLPQNVTAEVMANAFAEVDTLSYNFDDNTLPSGWTNLSDTESHITVSEGYLILARNKLIKAVVGNTSMTDYVVQADFKLSGTMKSGNNAGIMFRTTEATKSNTSNDAYKGYYVGVNMYATTQNVETTENTIEIGYSNGSTYTSVKSIPWDIDESKEYTLKIVVYGENYGVLIKEATSEDSEFTLVYSGTQSLYANGQVGVRTYWLKTSFNNFLVRTVTNDDLLSCNIANTEQITVPVTNWECTSTYDGETSGKYEFVGTIDDAYNNPENLTAKATVTVQSAPEKDDSVHTVSSSQVTVEDEYWSDLQKQFICKVVPVAIERISTETGGMQNFKKASEYLATKTGNYTTEDAPAHMGEVYVDSDDYKVIEAMCFALQLDAKGDEEILDAQANIMKQLEEWIPWIEGAQEADGYLYTAYTLTFERSNMGIMRFNGRTDNMPVNTDGSLYTIDKEAYDASANLQAAHELYCAGHFYEAAVAHYNATGDFRLLNVAVKNADLVARTFGTEEGQVYGVPGHEEIELALVKLANLCEKIGLANDVDYGSKAESYLATAKFFLDAKGQSDELYDGILSNWDYYQNDAPVADQRTAHGHVVRAHYLYSAMADIGLLEVTEGRENPYDEALQAIWEDSLTKTYITGGIGIPEKEAYPKSYELPNDGAYCETCAQISNAMWNQRMNLLYGESKYADSIEWNLYNSILSCVNFNGDQFFYQNHLTSDSDFVRSDWYGTACCPPNLMRTVFSIGGYIYAQEADGDVRVNQYIGNTADLNVAGELVNISMTSDFPWYGTATLTVNKTSEKAFAISFRIPDWATGENTITLNNETISVEPNADGYVVIERVWSVGDIVELNFPMEAERIYSDEKVVENNGLVAVRRGPVIYCAESVDNENVDVRSDQAVLPKDATFTVSELQQLPGRTNEDYYGVEDVITISYEGSYSDIYGESQNVSMTLIPYYAWNNRGASDMTVYLIEDTNIHPLEYYATPSASYSYESAGDSPSHLNNGTSLLSDDKPVNNDRWSSYNTTAEAVTEPWVEYAFDGEVVLRGSWISWFDDGGGCQAPTGLTIKYWDGSVWKEVTNLTGTDSFPKNNFTAVNGEGYYGFDEITTTKIRLYPTNTNMTKTVAQPAIIEWRLDGEVADGATYLPKEYEAEQGVLKGQTIAKYSKTYGNPSANGYVGQLDNADSTVTMTVYAPVEGTYNMSIRYGGYAASYPNASHKYYINDNADNAQIVVYDQVNTWEDWYVQTVQVELDKGANTITFTHSGINNSYAQLDGIVLTKANAVQDVIDLIDKIGVVTKDSKALITAARNAYDMLSDLEKEQVTNYSVLVAAEKAYQSILAGDYDPTAKIDDCERVIKAYSAKKAASYLAGENTYPELEGYLFAGWYTTDEIPTDVDEALQCIVKENIPDGTDTVYALFVPEHVLSIKAQISAHLTDGNVNSSDEKASIRFVTSVDSLMYNQVGFEVSYVASDGSTKKATSVSNKVYQSLYVAGSNTEVWQVTPQGTFCGLSKYFKACTVSNIPVGNYPTEFTIKPFWVTLGGDKVYGVEAKKSIEDGCLRDSVYVSANGKDIPYYGSYNNPYATLDYAITHANNEGMIIVKDILTMKANSASEAEWTPHGKTVTITGESQSSKIDFTGTRMIRIYDNVTFENITLDLKTTDDQYIFAEGNKLVIKEDVVFSNSDAVKNGNVKLKLFGGSRRVDVQSTDVELYSGTYVGIYGGSNNAHNVLNDTKITVGGKVNANIDATGHNYSHLLLGGGYDGTVHGNTYITVNTGAKFNYIFGGGESKSVIKGSTNIDFSGQSYCVFGGSYGATNGATNGDTHVIVRAGEVYQLFGGSFKQSMTGNTDVSVLGGTVHRRIYGGCYNDYDGSWGSDYHVTGYTNVTISSNANVNLNKETDKALVAGTRYGSRFSDEWGTLIFNSNTYDNLSAKIGSSYFGSENAYHYIVKANVGGDVTSAGNMIYIKPDSGKVATVTIGNEVKHYTEGESYYILPSLTSSTSKETIVVTFGTEKITDFSSYEAKIGSAYYKTLEEAIAVAEKTNATVENLSGVKDLATISIKNSKNGTVKSEAKNYIAGATAEVTVTPDEGYYLSNFSVKKDDTEVTLSEEVNISGGTYTFTTEKGNYTVVAIFAKKVFETPTSGTNTLWDVSHQNQEMVTLPNGGTKISGTISAVSKSDNSNFNTLNFYDSYKDMDLTLTVKDDPNTKSNTATETRVFFTFGDKQLQLSVTEIGGDVVIRDYAGLIGKRLYKLTDAQENKYKSDEGVELRIVRTGTHVYLYVDGEECAIGRAANGGATSYYEGTEINLATLSNNAITADTEATVLVRRWGDAGTEVEMPFSVANEVNLVNVDSATTEHGTVSTDNTHYFGGDMVTLSVTPDEGYYLSNLSVKKNDTNISLDQEIDMNGGTYSFVADGGEYTVEATFAEKVFTDPTSNYTEWNLMQQNQGSVTLTNGRTGIKGVISATTKAGAGTNNDALYFNDEYTDMDLTLTVKNDNTTTAGSTPETIFVFDFGSGKVLRISITEIGGEAIIRTTDGILSWKRLYRLSDEQKANYKSSKGVELRIVRKGTQIYLGVDGVACAIGAAAHDNDTRYYAENNINLATLSDNVIKEDTSATVSIRRYGDEGKQIDMPFTITNEVKETISGKCHDACWDLTKQYIDVVTYKKTSHSSWGAYVYIGEELSHGDIDFSMKVKEERKDTAISSEAIQFKYKVNNTEKVVKFILQTDQNGAYITVRTNGDTITNTRNANVSVYRLSTEEYAQYQNTGINWRIVRRGLSFSVYINGVQCDLDETVNSSYSGLIRDNKIVLTETTYYTASALVTLVLEYIDSSGTIENVSIPYKLYTTVDEDLLVTTSLNTELFYMNKKKQAQLLTHMC